MISSWKRRASRRVFSFLLAAGVFGVAAIFPFRPADAATTCGTAVSEAGGSHKRCASSNGVFHVWTPSGFDATKTTYVVVYVHGWSDQCAKPSAQDATDGVPDDWYAASGAVYVDAAWSSHNLASQFAGGKLGNAVFVAIQAPTCGPTTNAKDPAHVDRTIRWKNFDDLLVDLGQAEVGAFNVPIVLIGHSGAYAHLSEWQNDNTKITHIIHLDTFYGNTSSPPVSTFKTWLKATEHKSSLIATSETKTQTASVVSTLKDAKTVSSIPSSLASMQEAARKARVLYIVANVTHMQLVTGGNVIPLLLQRVPLAGAPLDTAPTTTTQGTVPDGTSTSGSAGQAVPTENRPVLEIPIPNLNFTGIIRENGQITIPWLAQYIGGVYTFLLSIVGLMAAVMMVIGGFQYVTSGGDQGKIGAGKKRIVNALTGLVLALSSYVILYSINPDLVAFNGLQLTGVRTETLGDFTDGGLPTQLDPGVALPPPPPGSTQRTCDSTKTCLPYCRAADCTNVYCFNKNEAGCPPATLEGFDGVTLKAIYSTHSTNCVKEKFPNIPPGAPVMRITWPDIHNVIPNGQQASQLVIDGLQRAEKYIDDHHADEGLKITLRNCYRDTRLDFSWQCTIIMRAPPNNDPSSSTMGSTWPGSNPHSSGYACDLALTRGGKAITPGNLTSQRCAKYTDAEKLLVEILTNPTVGAKRLKYEYWHFNWGGWNSCYCAGAECDKHIAPVGCDSNSPLSDKACEKL